MFILLCLLHLQYVESKVIYFLPHSHDDVGWLDTVWNIYDNGPGVKNIISSYSTALSKDSGRRFVQVETIYFKKWYEEQDIETKQMINKLIINGQLEFAAGGWSMNDEATTYYEDIIDSFTGGHTYLYEQFRIIPRVGWQIDPFGHSSTFAYISYMMGMDGQYFARIDQIDKSERLKNKNLEFIWNPKPGIELFCHINYRHYSSPPGFDFDPLRSSPEIQSNQVNQKANQLLEYFGQQANYYKGETIVHTLGDDNEWSSAESYYKNIEKLIDNINQKNGTQQIHFSTPHQYLKRLNQQNLQYSVKFDDFFPYSDNHQSYWTGYYTSRISFKGYVRQLSKEFQQIKTFLSKQISYDNIKDEDELLQLLSNHNQNMGIVQHHDAITGTAKQFVNDDYIKLLQQSSTLLDQYMRKHVSILTEQLLEYKNYEYHTCYYNKTISECKQLDVWLNQNKTVLLALLMNQNRIIKLPVPNLHYTVLDENNISLNYTLLCDNQDCVLYFIIDEDNIEETQFYKIIPSIDKHPFNTKRIQISINDDTDLSTILNNQTKTNNTFKLTYAYYVSSSDYRQPSGAYIFRPDGQLNPYGNIINSSIHYDDIVTELIIKRNDVTTKIRKYKHLQDEYEIETFLDSIEFINKSGKEIVMLIDTDIENNDTFYTDSNGLDLQKRVKNYRETFNLIDTEPVSQNYYPVTNMILLNQTNGQTVAIINDRSQGGTSLKKGQIELMIHRRIGTDDRRGVGEALKEDIDDPKCQKTNTCNNKKGISQTLFHQLVFFQNTQDPNKARKIQLREDMIALKYFAEDFFSKFNIQKNKVIPQSYLDEIVVLDEDSISKIRIEPKQQYFIVRIHNLQEVGIIDFQLPKSVQYYQTTMNGLMTIEEWQSTKLNWQTLNKTKTQIQVNSFQVQPQFISTFIILR
ncbi:unnamed protein product [Paramecium pentaurelia]|uniref:Glycoside hydrolase family 38 central domain-containing protein n=1 Tax=Paramecium pentaurelia TaxID=43138 RepID=A0A8S1SXR2_9CILI|nr:unnamed protein product [Paramecium pentaurelia]